MSQALAPLTLDAFLEWERRQELRYEFDGVQPIAMTGGSVEHSVIATNLVRALEDRLHGTPCRAFRGDLKVNVAGRVRYPDAIVTCSPIPRGTDMVPDPVVVFEVLSPSTAAVDRIVKNEEYRQTPSIRYYVMLEQRRAAATVFSREGEAWTGRLLTGKATLELAAIAVSLDLVALYRGVELDDGETDD